MNDDPQYQVVPTDTIDVLNDAAASILDVGIVGALLLLSVAANVWLVYSLIRCYKSRQQSFRS